MRKVVWGVSHIPIPPPPPQVSPLKIHHFIFEKNRSLYFSSLPVAVQPPLKPNFYYKYVTNCLFFQPIESHNFFENMTNETTSSIPHGQQNFREAMKCLCKFCSFPAVLKTKFMCGYIEKLSEFNLMCYNFLSCFTCAKYFAFCRSRIFVS